MVTEDSGGTGPGRGFESVPHTVVLELAPLDRAGRGVLSRAEERKVLDRARGFGSPLLVLQAAPAFALQHLVDLVDHARSVGLPVAVRLLGGELGAAGLQELRDLGLAGVSLRLGGSSQEVHERTALPGAYVAILRTLTDARRIGLSTHVETPVTRDNLSDLEALSRLLLGLGVQRWSALFPTSVRDPDERELATAEEFEAALQRVFELAGDGRLAIEGADAPQLRRIATQAAGRRGVAVRPIRARSGDHRPPADGNGVVFVSSQGSIRPSERLPVDAGNVRTDDIILVYRSAPLFRALRDVRRLRGKCGACEFRSLCGGSRARAFATSGDVLQADPCCVHLPRRWSRRPLPEGRVAPRDTESETTPFSSARPPPSLREFLCSSTDQDGCPME